MLFIWIFYIICYLFNYFPILLHIFWYNSISCFFNKKIYFVDKIGVVSKHLCSQPTSKTSLTQMIPSLQWFLDSNESLTAMVPWLRWFLDCNDSLTCNSIQFNSISFIEKGTLQRTSKYSYSYYMIMTDLNLPSGSRQGRLLLYPFNINYTVIWISIHNTE